MGQVFNHIAETCSYVFTGVKHMFQNTKVYFSKQCLPNYDDEN